MPKSNLLKSSFDIKQPFGKFIAEIKCSRIPFISFQIQDIE